MELKEYLKILQNNLKLIIVATVLVALFGYIFSLIQPVAYEADASILVVPKPGSELKNVYEYDGYYALQAATSFNITLAGTLQHPDTVVAIFKKAGYEIDKVQGPKALSKKIKTIVVPNSFTFKFQLKERDRSKAQKLAKTTIEMIQAKVAEFNTKAGSKGNFEIIPSDPTIFEIKPRKGLTTLIGALVGLILGIFLAFLREYFKNP